MLLSYNELINLCQEGTIHTLDKNGDPEPIPLENINGVSIDLTLGNMIYCESVPENMYWNETHIDLSVKSSNPNFEVSDLYEMPETEISILPGSFFLASTREVFNLPNDIAAEYKLKSTLARKGLQSLFAGLCDPGWNGSTLTLELRNVLKYHVLRIKEGMKIGQIKFHRVKTVPTDKSYSIRGQYNQKLGTTKGGELR